MDRVPEPFNLQELMGKVEELTPFTIVALQECERMNRLMGEIRRSLKELELGLKVGDKKDYLIEKHIRKSEI